MLPGGRTKGVLAWAAALLVAAGAARAQDHEPTPDEVFESYLADRELWTVLASHLRVRLRSVAGEERTRCAEVLGRLYARMLGRASTPDQRRALEDYCRDLLRQVPEAESFELRIDLAKAEYLPVEEIVEKDRLRLVGAAERAEALRVLRHVGPTFAEISSKVGRRVDQLERQESAAREDVVEGVRAQLADARRVRSLARYYAGWVEYYEALLSVTPAGATRSLENFGYLLNAVPGRAASVERVPDSLLRFEHVARACIGCALANSLLGRDTEAMRWLDVVENGESVPPQVQDQVFARRLIICAAASRWADIEAEVRRRRAGGQPLSVPEARLLAVLALDAGRGGALQGGLGTAAERQAQVALGDLVKRGEIAQILDLVRQFGTAPIGNEGFIVTYVRGLQDFDAARTAHKAGGSDPDQPASEAALVNQYLQAAGLLDGALGAADADQFPAEVPRAMVRHGLALYYAGRLEEAARRFERAAEKAGKGEVRRDALWYAIVALDRAVEAQLLSAIQPRDRLATLYLREFPGTDQAAKLLLRQTRTDGLSDKEALEVLLGVPAESALYESARRQAARLLYLQVRRTGGTERDFAALRFADIAEPIVRSQHQRAMASADAEGRQAAEAVVLMVRQLCDALLGASVPDIQRVEAMIGMMESASGFQGLDLRPLEGEMTFRRLQMALARGDEAGAQRLVDVLRPLDAKFSDAADRLMFRRAQNAWRVSPSDNGAARQVVRHGVKLLDQAEAQGAPAADATVVGVREAVAGAAAALYAAERDTAMRDLAVRLDQAQIDAGVRSVGSWRRLAELREEQGDVAAALAAWNELLAGLDQSSPGWYEARYHSIRLLSESDPKGAWEAMRQHAVLHPEMGPAPWGEKLRELERALTPAGGGP